MEKNGFTILLLEIINNRAIKAFKARLNGHHLEVAGKTGTGKTTAVSALWEIMDPGNDRIMHGETKSSLKVILSDGESQIHASRDYTPSGSIIKVTKVSKDMEMIPISAKDFKGMISSLSSNPHEIKVMKDKDRVKLLLESAGIPMESYEAFDAAISAAALALGEAQSQKKSSAPGDEPPIVEPVSPDFLSKKIAEINAHNSSIDEVYSNKLSVME
jgi:ABC-type cobalamin/Fe3+-siderophores transport system ATPase subunit